MGQGYSTSLPAGPSAIEAAELSDLTFERSLGGARFLRTVRARHQHGIVVAKVCMKANSSVSFKQYARALKQERQALKDVPNVLVYQRIRETPTVGLLIRQFIHTSLYDRLSIRPFLENIEKKWIAFQLLCAVRDCHARSVFHGDIKSENVLTTSWGWVYLTDFSSTFKPVYLPEDNPADFSYYYDASARRTCYIAPERFFASGQKPSDDTVVQWNMDIFSLGCVIAELFTESPTFTLSQLFRYRKGEYDPTASLLGKIDDEHVRALITSMIRLNPEERWHAQDYLDEYKAKAFPLYFYQHLHVLMQEVTDPGSGRKPINTGEMNNNISDDRIDRVYEDFEMLSVSLGYGDKGTSRTLPAIASGALFPLQVDLPNSRHTASASLSIDGDSGTFILLNVVTASIRSAGRAVTKIRACELLLAFGERLPDEAKLDRILPYIMQMFDDSNEMVLVAALRTMTQLLALVTVASPMNSFLFTQYVFPRLQAFVKTKGFQGNSIVRATYATCLASLASTASRFLDMMQALRADGSLPPSARGIDDEADGIGAYYDAYDATRLEVLDGFEGQTKIFLTDPDPAVRRAFLSSVPRLCVFFGEARASDIILVHLNTYLNDPDWQLKVAFFKTIISVAVYIGSANLEEFILPLMVQALADPQEFVVEQALRSLGSMAEIGLLQRPKTWELIDIVARFQLHPNLWIKEAAANFVSAATIYLTVADVRILVTPLIQPYVKIPVSTLSEPELLDALKKPLPRAVFDIALDWAKRANKGLFWRSARDMRQLSYRAVHQMPPTSSVSDLGPRSMAKIPKNEEDEQWLGRLRNAGMRTEDEMKILAFREYLWRAAQRMKRDEPADHDPRLDAMFVLTQLGIRPQTVIFDNDSNIYEQRMRDQGTRDRTIAEALEEAVSPGKEEPFKRLSLHGVGDGAYGIGPGENAEVTKTLTNQPERLSGLRKQTSGSLSSSPSSAVGLLATRDGEHGVRNRSSTPGFISGRERRNKATAEVATLEATAIGRLNTPVIGSRRNSPAPARSKGTGRDANSRAVHNYVGNDPTVLKLLDALYVDNFPIESTEFGPRVESIKPGRILSSSNLSNPAPSGPWRPQGSLVAVLAEHTNKITRIAVAPDHAFFLTGSDDGTIKVWDSARLERNITHRARQTFKIPSGAKVTSLCFVDTTHTFVCTGSDGSVHVVRMDVTDSANGTKYGKMTVVREWQIPSATSESEYAVWTEHHRGDPASTLVIATNLCRLLAIDLRYMNILFSFQNPAHHGTPTCFCTGRRHDWLLVGTSQGVLDLWDLRFGLRIRSWAFNHGAPITRLQLHPSRRSSRKNRVCISGGVPRGEVTVWDIEKGICHEIYRPALLTGNEQARLRDYELINVDDDHSDGLLKRAVAIHGDAALADSSYYVPSLSTLFVFGLQQISEDADSLQAFAVTGGPDGHVRFWDTDRLEGCRLVSGGNSNERPTYTLASMGLDIRVMSEKLPATEKSSTTSGAAIVESNKVMATGPAKRSTGTKVASGKPTRYETIRLSAQGLLQSHLDKITDVAVLERPFGMILSADRSGQVFVHQ
ncbi:hypothetical protein M433DRAFT_83 [Acidomyces richmondensis BFW]|nr:MAG: hypothetical protein FE78DRAFT_148762 [Acidomyces sp. 'richmondensis']KYG50564.1 hypothetical protein M433DRAFT_83 [Acidomyces richmondensis BFW]